MGDAGGLSAGLRAAGVLMRWWRSSRHALQRMFVALARPLAVEVVWRSWKASFSSSLAGRGTTSSAGKTSSGPKAAAVLAQWLLTYEGDEQTVLQAVHLGRLSKHFREQWEVSGRVRVPCLRLDAAVGARREMWRWRLCIQKLVLVGPPSDLAGFLKSVEIKVKKSHWLVKEAKIVESAANSSVEEVRSMVEALQEVFTSLDVISSASSIELSGCSFENEEWRDILGRLCGAQPLKFEVTGPPASTRYIQNFMDERNWEEVATKIVANPEPDADGNHSDWCRLTGRRPYTNTNNTNTNTNTNDLSTRISTLAFKLARFAGRMNGHVALGRISKREWAAIDAALRLLEGVVDKLDTPTKDCRGVPDEGELHELDTMLVSMFDESLIEGVFSPEQFKLKVIGSFGTPN